MAYGENPEALLTIPTSLTYDKDANFGHASAGKDLVLTLGSDGVAALADDGDRILGKFVELHPDATASYMPRAHPMLLRKSSAAIVPGRGVIGAGGGQVKSTPATATAASAANGHGQAIKVLETGANGRILVLMP